MNIRTVHIIQLLVRTQLEKGIGFLVLPDTKLPLQDGQPPLALPTSKTVAEPLAPFIRGHSLENFVNAALRDQLKVPDEAFVIQAEIEPAAWEMNARKGALTRFEIYPVSVWIEARQRELLRQRTNGEWITCEEAAANPRLYPTARAVFTHLLTREKRLQEHYAAKPDEEKKPEAPQRLLGSVPDRPDMDMLAKKWFSQNKSGVRYLAQQTLNAILDSGNRAFNLRVADPYLRYQMQGVGFTWSFFTDKDKQDIHVHGAPVVEIYGVLEGQMEIWWKPYYDRGTSAWSHQILGPGDWIEVDSLQCHVVHWRTAGKGIIFKAGPGPLAGVGRLGEKGKTSCGDCPCMKPSELSQASGLSCGIKSSGKPRGLSVRALIRDEQGRLLLLRRATESRHFGGQWELPGGKVDAGESFDAALIREVAEETGFNVILKSTVGASDHEMSHVLVTNIFVEVTVTGGTLQVSAEHSEAKWCKSEEVAALDLAPTAKNFLLGLM
jgi:8-oxo-dGTP diphosphatase